MKPSKGGSLEKAKKYAFLLLKFGPRNKKELIFRLKQKNFSDATINKVVAILVKSGCIKDLTAREIAQQRFEELKNIPLEAARRRVYAYLLRRGFSAETVDEVIHNAQAKG